VTRRLAALARALESIQATCNVQERLAVDPVGVVRRHRGTIQRELVGLLSASLAFGNVKALRGAIEQVLARLGPDLPAVLDDRAGALRCLEGFQYRMILGRDIGRLLVGARQVQVRHGSLGEAFCGELGKEGSLRPALVGWTRMIREAAGPSDLEDAGRRGPQHVLPDPGGSSGCKRLMLYLRWMVRPDDGVDLGLWRAVSPSILLIPVDTHIHRLGVNLGMTRRAGPSWLASEDITGVLREIDPGDPVRFDFALCHLGMAQGCTGRSDSVRCPACGAREVCKVWKHSSSARFPSARLRTG
jgi:uncharacterized protein (TIGR02757 family)